MREQSLYPFEKGKILEFNGHLISAKSILNLEAYAALILDIPAQEFQRNIFGRHGNRAVLYVNA